MRTSSGSLALPTLRLLTPPLRLLSAALWQVVRRGDVTHYGKLEEFVTMVTDTVPALLSYRQKAQLLLGLRARSILEMCRGAVELQTIQPHLDRIHPSIGASEHPYVSDPDVGTSEANFLQLVHSILKDSLMKEHFFQEVFPVQYGARYDAALQGLVWEFLCRLDQLLPVPDLDQIGTWLTEGTSVFEECSQSVAMQELKILLQLSKCHGPVSTHGVASTDDYVFSSLSMCHTLKEVSEVYFDDSLSFPNPSFVSGEVEVESVMEDVGVELALEAKSLDSDTITIQFDISSLVEEGEGNHGFIANENADMVVLEPELLKQVHPALVKQTEPAALEEVVSENMVMEEVEQANITVLEEPGSVVVENVQLKDMVPEMESVAVQEKGLGLEKVEPKGMDEAEAAVTVSVDKESVSHTGPEVSNCVKSDEEMDSGNIIELCQVVSSPQNPQLNGQVLVEEKVTGNCSSRLITSCLLQQPTIRIHRLPTTSLVAEHTPPCTTDKNKKRPQRKVQISAGIVLRSSTETSPACSAPETETANCQQSKPAGGEVEKSNDQLPVSPKTHSCPDCTKVFRSLSELVRHNRSHTGERPYSCSGCDKSFQNSWDLRRHEHTHRGERPYQCSQCDKCFTQLGSLRQHNKVAHRKDLPFSCSQCSRSYVGSEELERHLQTHTLPRPHKCTQCDKSYSRAADMRRHQFLNHTETRPHHCSQCNKAFKTPWDLSRHIRTHTGERLFSCTECDKHFTETSSLRLHHQRVHDGKSLFSCLHCQKTFTVASALEKHMRCHIRRTSYQCDFCHKSFTRLSVLDRHQRMHTGERPYLCSQCGKRFLSHGELIKHHRCHSEERPHTCTKCSKTFKSTAALKKHSQTHMGLFPFSCAHCEKRFTNRTGLSRHELTHTGERPHLCTVCGKTFLSLTELLVHKRYHTGERPYSCSQCSKSFAQSYYLTVHLRTHTGERPYHCKLCPKSFSHSTPLKRHMRTHTGEKLFQCSLCGESFSRHNQLKVHEQSHVGQS